LNIVILLKLLFCNLASIGLSMFVNEDKSFDYDKLHQVVKVVTDNLNKVIEY